jgi:hypothetical protein
MSSHRNVIECSVFVTTRALIVAVALVFAGCSPTPGEITVRNASSERIAKVQILVGHERIVDTNFAAGESRHYDFAIREDAHYDVSVVFQSGRELYLSDGYVTSGMKERDELNVHANGIELIVGTVRP